MKNAILLHGTFGNPENFWFGWLKRELETQGYRVTAPQLPEADTPNLSVWTPFALQNLQFDSETLLIGHSAGCPLALSILDKLSSPIHRTILVAGFIRLDGMKDDDAMLLQSPDWEKIKSNGNDFFFFNSDNDPWGCTHKQGEALREKLGGTLIVRTGEGHFGSQTFKQPYDTFAFLKEVCLLQSWR
ncbi:MAG: alpha/beta hydrolase [Alphaproteobacteria bacterium]|nr:alpha/beta hydrolase [Alphaproteobacteria bacterium]